MRTSFPKLVYTDATRVDVMSITDCVTAYCVLVKRISCGVRVLSVLRRT